MRSAFSSMTLVLLAAAGCGEEFEAETDPPPPCWQDPWTCPDRQTCWFDTMTSLACLNVGQGLEGQACEPNIGAARCEENLFCLSTAQIQPPVCTFYCDPADTQHACPMNRPCLSVQVPETSITVHVCTPP
jgi:hypothetical protein